jgi:hypothetical protein
LFNTTHTEQENGSSGEKSKNNNKNEKIIEKRRTIIN